MILVTGSNGFMGKVIIAYIEGRKKNPANNPNNIDWTWMGYDLPERTIINPDPWNPGASKEFGGNGVADLEDKIKRVDFVLHAAAIANLNDSALDHEKNRRVNVEGTENVGRICAKYGKTVVYISTCCAYGNEADGSPHKGVITEKTTPHPTEVYAQSKLEGEKKLDSIPGLKWRVARVGTFFGPGMRKELFNYIALDRVAKGLPVMVHGDGKQTRTYIHVDDVVSGAMAVLEFGVDGNIYNVAGDEETSVLESIEIAGKITGKKPVIKLVENRQGQIFKEIISSEKLKKLGWAPKTPFYEGMKQTWEWMNRK